MKQVLYVGIVALLIITIFAFGIHPVTGPLPDIPVALYCGSGASMESVIAIKSRLKDFSDLKIRTVAESDIIGSGLKDCGVLIIPGRSAQKISQALGKSGCRNIEHFVSSGGGYIGISAGATLPALGENDVFSHIQLVNTKFPENNSKIWFRGMVECLALTKGGTKPVPFLIDFENGPVFTKAENPYLPSYVSLAAFKKKDAKGKTMQGDAIIATQFGMGRVLLFSPHPERTPGLENLLGQAIRWCAGKSMPQTAASGPEFSWEGIFGVSVLKEKI